MYRNLEAELVRYNITKPELARILNISIKSLYNRINGITDWNVEEVKKIQKYINDKSSSQLTLDYLFEEYDN